MEEAGKRGIDWARKIERLQRKQMVGRKASENLSHSFRWFQFRQFCTAAAFTDVPAWIPGFFAFAPLMLRPEDDQGREAPADHHRCK
jgi:hypothetical protein